MVKVRTETHRLEIGLQVLDPIFDQIVPESTHVCTFAFPILGVFSVVSGAITTK